MIMKAYILINYVKIICEHHFQKAKSESDFIYKNFRYLCECSYRLELDFVDHWSKLSPTDQKKVATRRAKIKGDFCKSFRYAPQPQARRMLSLIGKAKKGDQPVIEYIGKFFDLEVQNE